jgi:hypothetical protein
MNYSCLDESSRLRILLFLMELKNMDYPGLDRIPEVSSKLVVESQAVHICGLSCFLKIKHLFIIISAIPKSDH